MSRTLPFWAGALILILPATIMILAVVDALPSWIGFVLFLLLFSLPIPAALWTISSGVRYWKEQRLPSEPSPSRPPSPFLAPWWDRIGVVVSILLALIVIGGTIALFGWLLLKLVFG